MNAINELNHTSILVNINLNSVFRMVFRPNVFCFHSCFAYDRFMEKTETLSNIK